MFISIRLLIHEIKGNPTFRKVSIIYSLVRQGLSSVFFLSFRLCIMSLHVQSPTGGYSAVQREVHRTLF